MIDIILTRQVHIINRIPDEMNSDHRFMSFETRSAQVNINPYMLTAKNFAKADWPDYKGHIIKNFIKSIRCCGMFLSSISISGMYLSDTLFITSVKTDDRNIPQHLIDLMKQIIRTRKQYQRTPTIEFSQKLNKHTSTHTSTRNN